MSTGGTGQDFDVAGIGGNDLVTVVGEEHDGSINDIAQPCRSQQLSGGTSECLAQWVDIDSGQGLSQSSLARTSAPHLAHDAGMSNGTSPMR